MPGDGRVTNISLTAKGLALVKRFAPVHYRTVAAALDGLTLGEQQTLITLLDKMREQLKTGPEGSAGDVAAQEDFVVVGGAHVGDLPPVAVAIVQRERVHAAVDAERTDLANACARRCARSAASRAASTSAAVSTRRQKRFSTPCGFGSSPIATHTSDHGPPLQRYCASASGRTEPRPSTS